MDEGSGGMDGVPTADSRTLDQIESGVEHCLVEGHNRDQACDVARVEYGASGITSHS